jgi:manganese transport protein
MLVQGLSAKLGLATGSTLPALCRDRYRRPVVLLLWAQAELVAVATDVAEVVGGAIALQLLTGLPLLAGGLVTGVVAMALLALQRDTDRRFAGAVTALFAVILVAFLVIALRSRIDPGAAAAGLVPRFAGSGSLLLAAGILGATVMPHAIYLHSALAPPGSARWSGARRRAALRAQRTDVVAAMGSAGVVNATMLVVAAALFAGPGGPVAETLADAHAALGTVLDATAAAVFAGALLASGLASAGVGTFAGQVIMAGFLRRSIPLQLRRLLTLLPALAVLALGVEPTTALVVSQVALSFGIPFALVPLVLLTRRRDVMGELVNRPLTTGCAVLAAVVIISLNAVLLAGLV